MSNDEFQRLTRRTFGGDRSAPWWANWLIQAAVMVGVVMGAAWLVDWVSVALLGRPAFAVCGLVALVPLAWLVPTGSLVMMVGALILVARAWRPALKWLAVGMLLALTPDFLLRAGYGGSCAVPGLTTPAAVSPPAP